MSEAQKGTSVIYHSVHVDSNILSFFLLLNQTLPESRWVEMMFYIVMNFKQCTIVKLWIFDANSKLVWDTGVENLRTVQTLGYWNIYLLK